MDPFNEKKLISTKEASEESGYHSDYLARLCREGKIEGSQIGRMWFVSRDSLQTFVKEQREKKREFAEALAREREREYRAAFKAANPKAPRAISVSTLSVALLSNKRFATSPAAALLATVVIMGSGFSLAQAGVMSNVGEGAVALFSSAHTGAIALADNARVSPLPNAVEYRTHIAGTVGENTFVALIPDSVAALSGAQAFGEGRLALSPVMMPSSTPRTSVSLAALSETFQDSLTLSRAYTGFGARFVEGTSALLDVYTRGVSHAGESLLALGAGTRDHAIATSVFGVNLGERIAVTVATAITQVPVSYNKSIALSAGPVVVAFEQGAQTYATLASASKDGALFGGAFPSGSQNLASPLAALGGGFFSFLGDARDTLLALMGTKAPTIAVIPSDSTVSETIPVPPPVATDISSAPTTAPSGATAVTTNVFPTTNTFVSGVSKEYVDAEIARLSYAFNRSLDNIPSRASRRSSGSSATGVTGGSVSATSITGTSLNISGDTTLSGTLAVTGNVTLGGALTLTGITGAVQCLRVDALGVISGTGVDCGVGGSGLTALNGLSGASQTFATSTDANITLTVTSTGTTHTFTPGWTGTLASGRGGTGLSSVAANGLLIGNASGTGFTQIATSTLGLTTTNIAEGTNAYYTLARVAAAIAGTTTDALAEGATNQYYTNARARAAFSSAVTGLTYTSGTGVLSLTSGYGIPLTASSTQWNDFYTAPSNRITAGTNLSWSGNTLNGPTDGYVRALISAAGPLSYNSGTGSLSIPQASSVADGYLAAADFAAFNAKQAALAFTYPIQNSGNTISLAFGTTTENTWSQTQRFTGGASTTQLSVSGTAYFGSSATSTFDSAGNLSLAGLTSTLLYANSLGVVSQASVSSPLTFASGSLSVGDAAADGTIKGIASFTANDFDATSGNVSIDYTNGQKASASQSGFLTATDWNTFNGKFATTSTDYWLTTKSTTNLSEGANLYYTPTRVASVIAGTTTDALAEGSTNLYYTAGRVQTYLDSISKGYFFGTTSAAYFLSQNQGAAFSSTSVNYWLATKTTDNLTEGATNQYYTDIRARGALSSSATGLTYTSGTGVFSLTSGYNIPLTASTTDWNTAYNSRISSATYPVQFSNNVVSLAFGTTSSNTWGGTQTFTNAPILGALSGIIYGTSGTLGSVSVSSPLSFSAGTLSIQVGNGSQNGYIASGDWTTFNNKISSTSLSASSPLSYNSSTGAFSLGTVGVVNGGTGSTTLGGILAGNGTSAVKTVVVGSGLTWDGTTLATNGSGITAIGPAGQTQTGGTQTLATSTAGSDFTITASSNTITFNLPTASTAVRGALAASDFTIFNNKISSTSLSASAPLSYNSSTGAFTITQASGSTNGYLSSTDWNTFNTKFATTSADFWKNANNFFSTTSADYWKTANNFYSTTSADYWLTTKSTSNLLEGSNLYYTAARVAGVIAGTTTDALAQGVTNRYYSDTLARSAISNSIAGITYTSGTGVLSLTSGYTIPLTASTTEWGTAYTNRITSATYPLQIASNVLSLAFGTTTANTWSALQTFANATATQLTTTGSTYLATAGGNVGVGTTSPYQTFSVAGSAVIKDNNAALNINNTNGSTLSYGTNSFNVGNGYIWANTSGTNRFQISPTGGVAFGSYAGVNDPGANNAIFSGNVGIGTTSPSVPLAVQGNGLITGNLYFGSAATATYSTITGNSAGTLVLTGKNNSQFTTTASTASLTLGTTNGPLLLSVSAGSTGYYALSVNGAERMRVANDGNVGIATTSPSQALSVQGNGLFSGSVTLGGLTATGTANINTLTLTNALTVANGGTGVTSYTIGDILYADTTTTLAKLPVGTAGQVLKVAAGLPSWGADQTIGSGGSDGIFATSSGKIYPLNTSDIVLVGTNSTSTSNSIFEVNGQAYVSSKIGVATTSPVTTLSVGGSGYFTGGLGVGTVNTVAGTLQTSGNATIGGSLNVTGLSGLVYGNGGTLTNVSVSAPLAFSAGTLSITQSSASADGFLSSTDWNAFNARLSTSSLALFDKGYFFSTTSADAYLTTKTTSNLLEGSNLYYTAARVAGVIAGTTTDALAQGATNRYYSDTLARAAFSSSATGLTYTSGTGVFSLTSGYNIPLTASTTEWGTAYTNRITSATYPLQIASNVLSLAFGTTTANSWSNLQQFNGNASTTQLTATGGAYLATVSGNVGIGTAAPNASYKLDIQGSGAIQQRIQSSDNQAAINLIGTFGQILNSTGDFYLTNNSASGNLIFRTNASAEQMRITSTGNVGIGTTTPASKLSVQGSALFSGDLSLANLIASGTATVGNIINNGVAANSLLYTNGSKQESAAIISAPLSFSAGTLAIAQATTGANGYLSSTDFTTFNNKISSTSLSAAGPLAYNSSTGAFTISQASVSTNGYLSSSDFAVFNNKISSTSLSSTATGLTYTSATGIFSLTAGYTIPLTASTTEWSTAYTSRIANATYPLQIASNVLSLAFGTTTTNTWSNLQTFTSGFLSLASSTIGNGTQKGGLTISGGATTTGNAYIGGNLSIVNSAIPTQGTINFGTSGANVSFDGSNYMVTGGAWQTSGASIVAQSNSNVFGFGVKYNAGTGAYYVGASNSATPDLIFTNTGASETARITNGGNFGLGTTSPYAKLSVVGQAVAEYFTATSTAATSTFPRLSVTNFSLGSDYLTDITGSGLFISGGALTVDTGLAFSTTSTNYWKTVNNFHSTTSADYWLTTKSTSSLTEGTNLYYTDARARAALSSSATGLTYTSGTGVFSLTAGYNIPLTASTTEWASAYLNRITSATYPLQISSNVLSLAFGTTTANTWSALQTFTSGFIANASSTVTGAFNVGGQAYFAGNVGIGSTSPTQALSVTGNLAFTNSNGVLSTSVSDWYLGTAHFASQFGVWVRSSGAGNRVRGLDQSGGTSANLGIFANGERMTIDQTNGNVGIGSTSPYAKLSVHAAAGSNNTTLFAIGSSTASATTTLFSVLNNGYVGIGTANPTSKFQVVHTGNAGGAFSFTDGLRTFSDASGVLGWNAASHMGGGSWNNIGDIEYQGLGDGSNRSSFYVRGAGTGPLFRLDNSSAVTQMTVTAGGLLGLGTTTPSQALSVQGSALFSGDLSLANLTATGTATVGNLINNGVAANSLLYVNGSKQESAVTVSSPLTFTTGTLAIQAGNSSQNGYLASADWTTFNNKISSTSLSSSATGLTYTSATGVFSLTAGYTIPLTASTTEWGSAYANRITSATYPLQIASNVLSLAFGTTTSNTWSNLQTFTSGFVSQASSTVSGAFNVGGTAYFAGNVGVGTTTPGKLLDVYGDGRFGTSLNTNITLGTSDAATGAWWRNDGSNSVISTNVGNMYYGLNGSTKDLYFMGGGNTAQLFIKGSTGNVGIGTTTPSSTLSVQGNGLFSGNLSLASLTATGTASITGTATVGNLISSGLTANSFIYANGSKQLATGVVSAPLSFSAGTLSITQSNGSTNGYLSSTDWTAFNNKISSTSIDTSAELAALITNETGTGVLVFGTSPTFTTQITVPTITNAGTLALQATGANIFTVSTNGSERLRIDSAGDVGVGTTNPLNKLQVAGGATIGGTPVTGAGEASVSTSVLNAFSPTAALSSTVTTETAFRIARNGTNGDRFNLTADFNIGSYATGLNSMTQLDIRLGNGNANAPDMTVMSLLGNGNVGIGTTSPGTKLSVQGNGLFSGNLSLASLTATGTASITGTATVGNLISSGLTANSFIYANGSKQLATGSVSAPLSFSAGTLAIAQATTGANGYLSSTDFTTFNNKISSTSLSAAGPLAYNSSTGAFTISQASVSTNGYLSSSDFAVFNNKISSTSLSSTATGLTYTSATGIFSLTAGYTIPLTASTTEWGTAYTNRITSATYPLQISSNVLSLAFGTTTTNTWSNLQTFTSGFISQASSTISDSLSVGGFGYFAGKVGIGSSSVLTTGLAVVNTSTSTSGTYSGADVSGTTNAGSQLTGNLYGLFARANTAAGSANSVNGELVGVNAIANHSGQATQSGATAIRAQVAVGYGGTGSVGNTVTTATGIYIANPSVDTANSSSLGYTFGLYLDNQTAGTETNYTIYSAGGMNYFGGTVAVASSSASAPLSVTGNAGISGTLYAGHLKDLSIAGDSLVYANAASQLTGVTLGTGLTFSAGTLSVDGGSVYSTTSADYWLTTKSTTNLTEGTNLYYTDARARAALSSSATGLTYTSGTGVFSLTSGYSIPLTASTTEWGTAYTNRITSATYPLQISSNILSLAFGTTTINTWSNLQTFTSGFIANASSTVTGAFNVGGQGYFAGNVGIGTTSPYGTLSVAGTSVQALVLAPSNGARPYIEFNPQAIGSSWKFGHGLGNVGTNGFALMDGDANTSIINVEDGARANALTIRSTNAAGTVGIGTTTPFGQLSVTGLGTGTGFTFLTANSSNVPTFAVLDNGYVGIGTTSPVRKLSVSDDGTYSAYFSGRVGIGISAPSSGLDVVGNALIRSATNAMTIGGTRLDGVALWSLGSDSSSVFTQTSYSTMNFVTQNSSLMYFKPNGSEMLRLDPVLGNVVLTGNVGIGSTTPYAKLSVKGVGSTSGVNFQTTNSSDSPLFTILDNGSVGIGTAVPAYPLDVAGNINLSSNSSVGVQGNAVIQMNTSNEFNFLVSGANRVQIGSSYVSVNSGGSYRWSSTSAGNGTADTGLSRLGAGIVGVGNGTAGTSAGTLVAGNIGIGTTTPSQVLSVQGNALFSGNLNVAAITATGTITFSGLGTGLVKSTSGVLSVATAGTDFENPLTFSYPLVRSTNTISLAFGTTTTNTWSNLQTFANGFISQASSTVSGAFNVGGTAYFAGNVGVGTTSPQALFHVNRHNNAAIAFLASRSGATPSGFGIDFNSGYSRLGSVADVRFFTGMTVDGAFTSATERFTILSSNGNVGIGTSTPGSRLSVSGGGITIGTTFSGVAAADGNLFVSGNTNFGYSTDQGYRLGINGDVLTAGVIRAGTSGNASAPTFAFGGAGNTDNGMYLATTDQLGFSTAGTERVRIDQNGLVGIGTSTPSTKLQVYTGNTANADQGITLVRGNGLDLFGFKHKSDASGVYRGAITYDSIEAMTIFSNGNIGISSTTPSARFGISGSGTGTGRLFALANSSNAEKLLVQDNGDVTAYGTNINLPTDNAAIKFANSGNNGTIQSSGGILTINNGAGTAGADSLVINTTAGGRQLSLRSDAIRFSNVNNSTEYARFTSTGNLGIGTTTPDSLLTVGGLTGGAATFHGLIQIAGAGGIAGSAGGLEFKAAASGAGYGFRITNPDLGTGETPLYIQSRSNTAAWTDRFTILATNGNVGIGTTTPGAKLDVNGTGAFNGSIALNAADQYIYSPTGTIRFSADNTGGNGGIMEFKTNGAAAMTILNNGNVGIGTTTPGAKLHVNSTSATVGVFESTNSGGPNIVLRESGADRLYIGDGEGLGIGAGYNDIYSPTGLGLRFTSNASEAMRILTNGNVGIGTAAPGSKLSIQGGSLSATSAYDLNFASQLSTGRLSTSGSSKISSIHTYYDDATVELSAGSTAGYISGITIAGRGSTATPGESVALWTRSLQRLTVDGAGNVGIGTSTPAQRLVVGDGNSSEAITINAGSGWADLNLRSGASNGGSLIWSDDSGATNSGEIFYYHLSDYMSFSTAATERLRITSAGNVGIGTTNPTAGLLVVGNGTGQIYSAINGASSGSAQGAALRIQNGSSDIGVIGNKSAVDGTAYSSDLAVYTPNNLQFMTGGANTRMFISSTGNVGIGTVSPSTALLHVSGTAASAPQILVENTSTFGVRLGVNTSSVGFVGSTNATPFQLQTNGIARIYLDTSGNVGIGTTSPASKLSVEGASNVLSLSATTANAENSIRFMSLGGSGARNDWRLGSGIGVNDGFEIYDATAGGPMMRFARTSAGASTGALSFYTNGATPRLTVDSSGNVGIGTTTPGSPLHVAVAGATDLFRLERTNQQIYGFNLSSTFLNITDRGPGGAGATTLLSLVNSIGSNGTAGALGIGSSSPYAKLGVKGNGTTSGVNFQTTNSSDSPLFTILDSGLVGIGSSTPSSALSVFGNIELHSTPYPNIFGGRISQVDSGNGGLLMRFGVQASNGVWVSAVDLGNSVNSTNPSFKSYGTSILAATSGNVGIGTTTPSALLSVQGNSIFSGNLSLANLTATGTATLSALATPAGSFLAVNAQGQIIATTTPGGGGSGTVGSGTTGQFPYYAANGTTLSATSSLFLAANGSVGIGTTTPSTTLSIQGNALLSGNLSVAGITATSTVSALSFDASQYGGYKQNGSTILYASTTNQSVAVGASAAATWMSASSTAWYATAIGFGALGTTPTSGAATYNTATGYNALAANTRGALNTANGANALYVNTTGSYNTAIGQSALVSNTTGSENTVLGESSLLFNQTGSSHVAIGAYAGQGGNYSSNTGSTYVGYSAGTSVLTGASYNTLLGYKSGYGITSGARNTVLGNSTIAASYNQITTGSNNIAIGNDVAVASATASNQLVIGNLIYGTTLSGTGATVSTGNIGIASTTPWARLSIEASNLGSAPAFAIGSSSITSFIVTSAGKVGIGTTSPNSKLEILEANSVPQFRLSNGSGYTDFTVDSTGDLKFTTNGGDIRALSENLWVCDNAGCPALTATSTSGNIFVENSTTFGNGFSLKNLSSTELGLYDHAGSQVLIFDEGI